jgi:hypothetical protein
LVKVTVEGAVQRLFVGTEKLVPGLLEILILPIVTGVVPHGFIAFAEKVKELPG